jgi:starch synthase
MLMPRIALVRGHHLSKEETLSYEPLRNEFQFVCFTTNNPWFDHSEIIFPIITVPSIEGFFRTLPLPVNKGFGLLDNLLGAGQWMMGLPRRLRGFDIVHTSDYCHFFTYQAAIAKRKMGYKLVAIHYDNIPFSRDNKPLVRHMKEKLYEETDALFAMSERAREALVLEGFDKNRIFVIGNAVDTVKFQPRPDENAAWRERYGLAKDTLVILFVGRIRASKGVFELVYATKKLVSDPEIDSGRLHVIIAGRGPREQEVLRRIHQLRLEKFISLIGAVPHSEIHLLHNMADIFTLPSVPRKYWQEQFGIVLIESMACAKPVISTFSGSIPEVVANNGLLIQPNDHYALYLALKKLVLDRPLRELLGYRAREWATSMFSLPVISRKLKDAYTFVLSSQ